MRGPVLAAIAAIALFASAGAAEAATRPSSAFTPGSTIGVAWAGLSYDYALASNLLGVQIGQPPFMTSTLKLDMRGISRFYQAEGLAAGVIAGVQYDPGTPGQRSYLVPDAGIALAYSFPNGLTFMLNMTLTVDQYRYVDPIYPQPQGSLLQRLTLGPNTTVGAMLPVGDHLRLTVGGGSVVGMQLSY